jgi:antirestriction protein ArdC
MEKHLGLRYYNVFKVETQCENIYLKKKDEIKPEIILEPSEVAEEIIRKYIESDDAPTFNNNGSNSAYYSPALDQVVVPNIAQYSNIAEYYSTAFHELTHSTMKKSRCNREEDRKGKNVAFGSEEYSKEELVAEIGAAALVNFAGLETDGSFQNSASYIQGWSKKLKEQPKMIVYASAQAQKAIDYILSR